MRIPMVPLPGDKATDKQIQLIQNLLTDNTIEGLNKELGTQWNSFGELDKKEASLIIKKLINLHA